MRRGRSCDLILRNRTAHFLMMSEVAKPRGRCQYSKGSPVRAHPCIKLAGGAAVWVYRASTTCGKYGCRSRLSQTVASNVVFVLDRSATSHGMLCVAHEQLAGKCACPFPGPLPTLTTSRPYSRLHKGAR